MTLKNKVSRQEFKALTYPHMKLLYNVALKYCQNVFDAEDIVQETYLMAFNKFHQLREKSKCKSWLLRILRNNFLKSYHKKKSRQKLSEPDYIEELKISMAAQTAEELLANLSTKKIIQEAMDQLPDRYKEVLVLYHSDEMLYKDIALTLDIPIGTVMSRLTRARLGLKKLLLKQAGKNNILDANYKKQTDIKFNEL